MLILLFKVVKLGWVLGQVLDGYGLPGPQILQPVLETKYIKRIPHSVNSHFLSTLIPKLLCIRNIIPFSRRRVELDIYPFLHYESKDYDPIGWHICKEAFR